MQGRPELQITVPADQSQGQPSPIQVTLNQTVTTAPTQPLSLQPNSAVQGTVDWSPSPGPVTTTSATWQQQPAPQQQFGWQQRPNLIPPWPALWNLTTGSYNIQQQPTVSQVHTPVPWDDDRHGKVQMASCTTLSTTSVPTGTDANPTDSTSQPTPSVQSQQQPQVNQQVSLQH